MVINLRQTIYRELRHDFLPILFFVLALLILTYPLVLQLSDIIPLRNMDTYTAIWQNWWMKEALATGQESTSVNILFHPVGLNTEIQPRRWVTFPLWTALFSVFGEPAAYNLTVLFQALLRAYGMYRLILIFIPHRPSAWVGGAVFAYSASALSFGLQQPQVGSVEFLPIFMIAWVVAIRHFYLHPDNFRRGLILMTLASVGFSLNIYQSTTVGIFALLAGGMYLIWMMIWHQLWRNWMFWMGLILYGVLVVVLTAPIILPLITSDNLNNAIGQFTPGKGLDVLLYFQMDLKSPVYYNQWLSNLNGRTISPSPNAGFAKLSILSLVVAGFGVIYMIRKCRQQLIWIIISITFFVLSLGMVISINGVVASEWTPYHLLLNNPLFVIVRDPGRFQVLMLFGYAMVTAFGMFWLSERLHNQYLQRVVMAVFAIAILFETSIAPLPFRSSQLSPAYDYLMESGEAGAIIEIPMHRQASKVYMYAQTFHQRRIVEGMTGRMPPDAYTYIESNPFLDTIVRRGEIEALDADLIENWQQVIQDLLDDGFRYVVVHHSENDGIYHIRTPDEFVEILLPDVAPVFESDRASVYDLLDIQMMFG